MDADGEAKERPGRLLTSIKLLAVGEQSAPVVHGQLIALLGLALALDGVGDIDLEVLGGDDANGARGQGGEKQGCLHGGETWDLGRGRRNEANEAVRKEGRWALGEGDNRASLRTGGGREREQNIWPMRNGFRTPW